MMKFDRSDLLAFLRMIDTRLTRPCRMRLIGGAVVGLCHLPAYRTRDIDYAWADREVQAAIAEIRREDPRWITTAQSGVYFAPYTHEDRLLVLDIPGLVYLSVEVPERHDLAVMKICRGLDRDLEVLEEMHAREPFVLATLVLRFEETWVTGPRRLADLCFLCVVEALFSEEAALETESKMQDLRRRD